MACVAADGAEVVGQVKPLKFGLVIPEMRQGAGLELDLAAGLSALRTNLFLHEDERIVRTIDEIGVLDLNRKHKSV